MNISLLKYIRIAWLMRKLNARKSMCIINGNAVWGRLSENYRMKYFGHEIFVIYGNFYAFSACGNWFEYIIGTVIHLIHVEKQRRFFVDNLMLGVQLTSCPQRIFVVSLQILQLRAMSLNSREGKSTSRVGNPCAPHLLNTCTCTCKSLPYIHSVSKRYIVPSRVQGPSLRFPKHTKSCSHFPKLLLTNADLIKETMAKMATQSRD